MLVIVECKALVDCNGRKTSTRVFVFFLKLDYCFTVFIPPSHCSDGAFLRDRTSVFAFITNHVYFTLVTGPFPKCNRFLDFQMCILSFFKKAISFH